MVLREKNLGYMKALADTFESVAAVAVAVAVAEAARVGVVVAASETAGFVELEGRSFAHPRAEAHTVVVVVVVAAAAAAAEKVYAEAAQAKERSSDQVCAGSFVAVGKLQDFLGSKTLPDPRGESWLASGQVEAQLQVVSATAVDHLVGSDSLDDGCQESKGHHVSEPAISSSFGS